METVELTTVLMPVISSLFLAVVVLVVFIFKNQTKRSKEWQVAKDLEDKKRDETLSDLKTNVVALTTLQNQLNENHILIMEKLIA